MVFKIEPVALRPIFEAEFVPEATDDADPRTDAGLLNLFMGLVQAVRAHYVDDQLVILAVEAPVVGKDPGNLGFDGGGNEFALLIRRSCDTHGDDEDFLAFEGFDEAGVVGVIDFGDLYPCRWGARTFSTGDGRQSVLASLEQLFRDKPADRAADLTMTAVLVINERRVFGQGKE